MILSQLYKNRNRKANAINSKGGCSSKHNKVIVCIHVKAGFETQTLLPADIAPLGSDKGSYLLFKSASGKVAEKRRSVVIFSKLNIPTDG